MFWAAHVWGMSTRGEVALRFRLGDVVRYVPVGADVFRREGLAVVQEDTFGTVVAVDTFEVSPASGSGVLSDDECRTGVVLFNMNDVHAPELEEEFDLANAHVLTHGHGTVRQVFVDDDPAHAHPRWWHGRTAA